MTVTPDKIGIIQKALTNWGRTHYADFPWRSSTNSLHVLVAEIMLQRTKAEQVVPVYSIFASKYKTPSDVISEKPSEISRLLEPLGLKWRSKKIVELACELYRRKNIVPKDFSELVALPGIGPYIANAYLSLHAQTQAPIIDANAVRLWTRVFDLNIEKEMRRDKEFLSLVKKITPKNDFRAFNYAVLDHTRTICKRKPLCNICPIKNSCSYYVHSQPST